MKRAAILLGAAILALAGSIAVRPGLGAAEPVMAVNDAAVSEGTPATLAEYGFFVDAVAQLPASGVTPYRLNTPLYSDGADKLRFVYVPAGQRPTADGAGLLRFRPVARLRPDRQDPDPAHPDESRRTPA